MIPANIDHAEIIRDLHGMGWLNYNIEQACGFSNGYVGQLTAGRVKQMTYQKAARLYNLWWSECEMRGRLCTRILEPLWLGLEPALTAGETTS